MLHSQPPEADYRAATVKQRPTSRRITPAEISVSAPTHNTLPDSSLCHAALHTNSSERHCCFFLIPWHLLHYRVLLLFFFLSDLNNSYDHIHFNKDNMGKYKKLFFTLILLSKKNVQN